MKNFKQFIEEAYNKVIILKDAGWGRPHKFYKKNGETRYGPTGDRLFKQARKKAWGMMKQDPRVQQMIEEEKQRKSVIYQRKKETSALLQMNR